MRLKYFVQGIDDNHCSVSINIQLGKGRSQKPVNSPESLNHEKLLVPYHGVAIIGHKSHLVEVFFPIDW